MSIFTLINFSNCFMEISAKFCTIFWNFLYLLTFAISYASYAPSFMWLLVIGRGRKLWLHWVFSVNITLHYWVCYWELTFDFPAPVSPDSGQGGYSLWWICYCWRHFQSIWQEVFGWKLQFLQNIENNSLKFCLFCLGEHLGSQSGGYLNSMKKIVISAFFTIFLSFESCHIW